MKMMSTKEEHILGQPNGLLRLLSVINESIDYYKEETDFRRFIVNKMRELFDECGERECEQYFDIAFHYNFIVKQTKNDKKNNKNHKYVLNKSNASHDWFCFECDILVDKRSKQYHKCKDCWRVFHSKCLRRLTPFEHNFECLQCLYCKRLSEEKEGFIGLQRVDNQRLNTLIKYLLIFLKNQMKESYNLFTIDYGTKESMIVFKKMDLKVMEDKTKSNSYKSLLEFENDFFIFMHNLYITTYDFEAIAKKFADLKEYFKKEIIELRICVDCYERSNDKGLQMSNKDWFCEPCDPPHKVLFAKIKGFPYWPAKLIKDDGNGRYIIRFFDKGFTKLDVKANETHPIEDFINKDCVRKNNKLKAPMKMLDKYLTNFNNNSSLKQTPVITAQQITDNEIIDSEITDNDITDNITNTTVERTPYNIQHIENCIEEVVNEVYNKNERKSSRILSKRKLNYKQTLGKNKSFTVIKSRSNSSDSSINCVPLLETDLSSVKKIKLQTNKKLNVSQNNEVIDKNISNQTLIQTQKVPQNESMNVCEQTNVEASREAMNEANKETVVTERPLDGIEGDLSFGNLGTNSMLTESSVSNNANQKLSELQINTITPNISQNIGSEVREKRPSLLISTNENEVVINDLIQKQFEYNSKEINKLFEEVLDSEGSKRVSDIKDKIICIKYYYDKQIEVFNKKLKQNREKSEKELSESKRKNWCAVCQKFAKLYCCVRFYCSTECQSYDWQRGHSKQCLARMVTTNT